MTTCTVTAEAIKKNQHTCHRCPVALAINEHLAPGYWASASTHSVGILQNGSIGFVWFVEEEDVPQSIRDFITEYDKVGGHARVAPFAFELDIPSKFLKE